MASCQVCGSVFSMKRCTACNSVWCKRCAREGHGHYPKQAFDDKCPYCGTFGKIVEFDPNAGSGSSRSTESGCAAVVVAFALVPILGFTTWRLFC